MIMLYFSGTGNSKFVAEKFSEKAGCECHSIEEKIDFKAVSAKHDTVAVCYPIYASSVPRIMRNFVKDNPEVFDNKKLIIFCTQMMFSGDGAKAFTRLVKGSEDRVIYAEHFNMPNNISNSDKLKISEKERLKKIPKAEQKIEKICNDLKKGKVFRRGWGSFSEKLGKIQNTTWYQNEEKRKSSFKAAEDCIKCGLCAKNCPVQNLSMGENGVVQHDNCILCFRCVNLCPVKAAMVLKERRPEVQYKGPVQ